MNQHEMRRKTSVSSTTSGSGQKKRRHRLFSTPSALETTSATNFEEINSSEQRRLRFEEFKKENLKKYAYLVDPDVKSQYSDSLESGSSRSRKNSKVHVYIEETAKGIQYLLKLHINVLFN